MTFEDIALRFEGIDPAKFKAILDNISRLLGIAEAELPHIKQVLTDIRAVIAAYEANQRRFAR